MHQATGGRGIRIRVVVFSQQRHLRDGFHARWSPNSVGQPSINVEGWELTKYSDCYWHANFVNFNGKAHTFKNNTWIPINPNLEIQGHRFIDTMPLEADNSLGMILQLHPTITSHPLSASTIMADILSYIQMGYVTEISGSLLGLYIPCCRFFNPCSWLTPPQPTHRDIELAPQRATSLVPSTPVTIVNIPPAPTPAGPNPIGRLALNQQQYLSPPTSYPPENKSDSKETEAAWWVCDMDDEDILYCADHPTEADADGSYYDAQDESFLDASDDESLEELVVGSCSSNTSTIILHTARDDTTDDNITVYCWSQASTILERGLDRAALNDSIARLRGRRCYVRLVSSQYTFDSDDDNMASARYVERTYRLPSQKEHEYGWEVDESDMPGDYSWSVKDEPWPRAFTPCDGRRTAAGPESAIGSGSESDIGPGHFQLESPNLVHFCYANITHNTGKQIDPGLIYQYWHNRNGQEHWRAVFIRDNFISSGITEMDKVWRLKLEMTRADVRFRYAANNGAKQHWTNIQHSNIKN
ncbi:hypothetical protein OUZ56_011496 [Daphnia magna]|uniref:Uncharacterized protein n=1 Tax=Daphnia magna TaxID=35525 RepID=A0ABQ9Z0C5_9CRUS|nr:hypothetical protein OUZ56_011496 [Daphnia magna]